MCESFIDKNYVSLISLQEGWIYTLINNTVTGVDLESTDFMAGVGVMDRPGYLKLNILAI